MKYIRTEDGILKVDGYDDRGVCVCSGKTFYRDEYINQADTIEKLLDEFVVIASSLSKPHNYSINEKTKSVMLDMIETSIVKIYGAIWTDKGLIYVAKLNDNGDLKLL